MKSIQSVVINLGGGDFVHGFPAVTAQLRAEDNSLSAQFTGKLSNGPRVAESYQIWQSTYRALSQRLTFLSRSLEEEDDDDELEIEEGGITQVSQLDFAEISQNLINEFNYWLQSPEFLRLEQKLRSHLNTAEAIRIIIETDNELVKRLPWHCWQLLQDYPDAEIALSRPEYKQLDSEAMRRQKVRILAILGNSQDIDVEAEKRAISALPDAETKFLVQPSRQEFDRQLWDTKGWDILFFAGHSQTEGETGRIYINEEAKHNSLTIEQLEEALKAAIAGGLKLAIFNSCDGLGLANALEKLHIPQVIVMREPVPNLIAEQFFHHFLIAFAVNKLPLYRAVKQARRQLQGLEQEYPAASWLPIICQNPAVRSPTWLDLGGIPPCPYRGLFAFREEDAGIFFGRENCINNLLERVESNPLLAIVGASGSGKSSVVFAGLIPKLRQAKNVNWQIVALRPGNNAIAALINAFNATGSIIDRAWENHLREDATALTQLVDCLSFRFDSQIYPSAGKIEVINQECREIGRKDPINATNGSVMSTKPSQLTSQPQRLLVVIDQFEELYTLCSESERQAFLDGLITAINTAPAFNVVITLRADFYGAALAYRPLSDILQGAVYNLSVMNPSELHNAIALPAAQMQVRLEAGLTDKLIAGVSQKSGRLPLLEFTLTQLWSAQQNGWLTHRVYQDLGGVESALANHAEAIYRKLDRSNRDKMPAIFLQLVQLGEETEVTRRLATKDELRPENWDLVAYLADNRLVTIDRDPVTSQETVEIVHEALITSWGRLTQWIKIDEEFRRWQQRLRRAIATWENSNGDRGALLRGKLLADAQYWLDRRWADLSNADRDFIQRSIRLQEKERATVRRRRKFTIAGLIISLAIAILLSGVAVWQWQSSAVNEIFATSKYAKLLCASAQGFDGLIESLKAARQLEYTPWAKQNPQLRESVMAALQETVYGVRERNRIKVGEGELRSISISADGKTIASGGSNAKLSIFNRDGSLQAKIDTQQQQIEAVTFSPDGQILATAGADGTIKLWSDRKLIKTLKGHQGKVLGISFSPDTQTLASVGEDGTIKLWQRNGKLKQIIPGNSDILYDVSYSPDGQMLATAGRDGTVRIWSKKGQLLNTISGYNREVLSVAFSPDGKTIGASSEDGTMRFWNLDGTLIDSMFEENVIHRIQFTPDGRTIVSVGGDTTVKLWNSDYTLRQTFTGHTDGVLGLALSQDGKTIATASADGTIKLWQLDSKFFKTLHMHDAKVYTAIFNPDGNIIATASGDNTVKLWNPDGTLINTLKGHTGAIHGISFSPDGNIIATASWDKTIKLWKRDGILLNTLTGHTDKVYMAEISPDGQTIASASGDGTVKLWALDGTLLKTLTGHQDVVHGVSFSPDGKIIASASHDRTIKLWTSEGKLIKTLQGHSNWVHGVSFSPDGKIIASASHDRTIKLWSRDGKLLQTIVGHTDKVLGVAFSHDGQILASSSRDGSVKLWHLDGKLIGTLRGHGNWVHWINFSADDRTLASASYDNTAILWDLTDINNLDVLVGKGCNWVRDYLQTNPNAKGKRNLCQNNSPIRALSIQN